MNKSIFTTVAVLIVSVLATKAQHIPNWQNKDLQTDSLFGISTEKAYQLVQGKKPTPVIVAVIDAGVDTLHEDLKKNLWVNHNKKKNDDGTYGWSYLGSARGNVQYDNLEVTRQVRRYIQKDTSRLPANDLMAYHSEKKDWDKQKSEAVNSVKYYTNVLNALIFLEKQVVKENPKITDLREYLPNAGKYADLTKFAISQLMNNDDYAALKKDIQGVIDHFKSQSDYQLNLAFDPRSIVGDDYNNSKQKNYGSPDVMGPDAHHGTHVAGIIAAVRNNGIGPDGIADNVRILSIRAVPDGDERDKDIANAIRYAADHGAKVINMSFGKDYSPDKKVVDEAVNYAIKKDVLLIQAAGNANKNIDLVANFPTRNYLNGKQADAYIVVGASGSKDDSLLKAKFSNYGKTAVDVFAPGVQIYSSIPGSKYDYYDGTSMAAPIVAGLAALIREYYPNLSALQVKDIILKTVIKRSALSNYCSTGGVVNAYNALQLAATY